MISYDRRAGRYRGDSGKFVSRSIILKLVDQEAQRLSVRSQAHTRNLAAGNINLPEWQRRVADDLKLSSLRMGALSAGGAQNLTQQQYGAIGRGLRTQYEYLLGFAVDLSLGRLTEKQAIARAGLYGSSTRAAFFATEKLAKKREGLLLAMRSLDAAAQHCSSCILYDTHGKYLPLEQVKPPTVDCECRQRCRCVIVYKRG